MGIEIKDICVGYCVGDYGVKLQLASMFITTTTQIPTVMLFHCINMELITSRSLYKFVI